MRLDCTMTQIETRTASTFGVESENRAISIMVNEEKNMIMVYENNNVWTLKDVQISQIAMNGNAKGMSLGIQRFPLDIALQFYDKNATRTEFGSCSEVTNPPS